jgi:superfamily II DNA or RNA helicase
VNQYPGLLQSFSYRFEQRVDFGYDNYDENPFLEEWVHMYREVGEYYVFSRGDLNKIYSLFHELEIIDKRSNVPLGLPLKFTGKLKDDQKLGLKQFLDPNIGGIFQAKPGYGKTVVMNAFVTLQQQKTLLLVNKTDLKEQFIKRMRDFTNINELEKQTGKKLIGELSFDGSTPIDFPITVATYQLVNYDVDVRLKAIQNRFGLVMVDECHRAPAHCLTTIIKHMNPLLFVGVSATPKRKDNYHLLLPDLLGPVRFASSLTNACAVEIIHGGHFPFGSTVNWVTIVNAVAKNAKRNEKIVDHVIKDVQEGHRVIVLSDRIKHAEILCEALRVKGIKAGCIVGPTKDKDSILEQINMLERAMEYLKTQTSVAEDIDWDLIKCWDHFINAISDLPLSVEVKNKLGQFYHNRIDVLCASTKLFSEGSDIPCISSIHITTPTANENFIEQAIGRVQRDYPIKLSPKAVYYKDGGCGILFGCAKKFRRVCESVLHYSVEEDGHAPAAEEDIYAV